MYDGILINVTRVFYSLVKMKYVVHVLYIS